MLAVICENKITRVWFWEPILPAPFTCAAPALCLLLWVRNRVSWVVGAGRYHRKTWLPRWISVNCPYLRMIVLQCLPLPIPNSLLCPPFWLLAVSPLYLFLLPVRFVFSFTCYNLIFAYLESCNSISFFLISFPNFTCFHRLDCLVTILYCVLIWCDQIKCFPLYFA